MMTPTLAEQAAQEADSERPVQRSVERDLHDEVLDAINTRREYERHQATFAQMREDGVGRARKPFPGAADMHYPLADGIIEKLKPYYLQQLYMQETLAQFVGTTSESAQHALAASRWFDYQLRHRSNFEEFAEVAVDLMLERGRVPVLVRWDIVRKRLCFEPITPLDFIVPAWTRHPDEADWIVHVQRWSVAKYKRLGEPFRTDADFVRRIAGAGDERDHAGEDESRKRAGITHAETDKEIVLWVLYRPCDTGWRVRTYAPVCPDEPVRPDFDLPYERGCFAGPERCSPFSVLTFENRDSAYHKARGVCRKVAPFEQSLNKDWNTIKDHQTLTGAPVFRPANGVTLTNTTNLTMRPGALLPVAIEAVQMPSLPGDIAGQMGLTRQTAEQLVAVPDFGTGGAKNPGGNKTATEISVISSTMGNGVELRARAFRREVAAILRRAWALLLQYASADTAYLKNGALDTLDSAALSDAFHIEPAGSGDSLDRQQVIQQAYARLNLFRDDPYINQAELRKAALEAHGAAMVRRLYQDPAESAADQAEAQAQEITVLRLGFPARLKPQDNHAAHLTAGLQYIEAQLAKGRRFEPEEAALIARHLLEHLGALRKQDAQAAAQFAQAEKFLRDMDASGTRAAQAAQQQQPAPLPA